MHQWFQNFKNISTTKWISYKPWQNCFQEISTGSMLSPFLNNVDMHTEDFSKELMKKTDQICTLDLASTTTWLVLEIWGN